ncbi:MAG: hypothetical protein RIQ77_551 [Pseudomonadota bacterium]|jgi:hypothetical protein
MSTSRTPGEIVQEAQALLLSLAKDDLIAVVGMPDSQMTHFVYHLGNLLSLVLRMSEATVEASDERAKVRAGEVDRLRKLASLVQQ